MCMDAIKVSVHDAPGSCAASHLASLHDGALQSRGKAEAAVAASLDA